jgi:hypothetical protein
MDAAQQHAKTAKPPCSNMTAISQFPRRDVVRCARETNTTLAPAAALPTMMHVYDDACTLAGAIYGRDIKPGH